MSSTSQLPPATRHSSDRRNFLRKRGSDSPAPRTNAKQVKDNAEATKTETASAREARISKKRPLVEERSLALVNEQLVHLVGDLVWAKIPGHPWWPSMVAYDPNTAEYFQCAPKSQTIAITKYHVQFFGDDPLRGWVSKHLMINFLGKHEFAVQLKSSASPKESVPAEGSSHWAAWLLAVEQAERALTLTRQDRKLAYVFNYQTKTASAIHTGKNSKKTGIKGINKSKSLISVGKEPKEISTAAGIPNATGFNACEGNSSSNTQSAASNPEPSETASDSGIEDLVSSDQPGVDQAANLVESQEDSDMEGPSSKRQRKQKVYEGFHAGLEFDQAFKSRKRDASFSKFTPSELDSSSKDNPGAPSTLLHLQEQAAIMKKHVSDLEKLKDSASANASKRACHSGTPCSEDPSRLPLLPSRISASFVEDVEEAIENKPKGSEPRSTSKTLKKETPISSLKQDIKQKGRRSKSSTMPTIIHREDKDACSTTDSLDDEGNGDSLWKHKRGLIVCSICEVPSTVENLIACSGNCLNSFHVDCIGLSKAPKKDFLCDECLTGHHACFICKDVCTPVKRCSAPNCGKRYHLNCIMNLHIGIEKKDFEGKFSCPLHSCRYCSNNDDNNVPPGSGKLLKCIKCPTAYHSSTCVAAGSARITMQHMICDRHVEPDRINKHINVNWCFVCSQGGTLLCCDSCPASYHPECADGFANVSDSPWQCENCKLGRKPRYGDIVWVKFGVYRWWPAKIFYAEEVPERIQKLSHSFGDFPVFFFGSRDYSWLRSSRCFNYQEGDRGGSARCSAALEKYFKKALEEARDAYRELQQARQEQANAVIKRKSNKPTPYTKIKQNKAVTCVRSILDASDWPVCECTPKHPCDSDSECLNRMLFFECNAKTCKAGELCGNQRMQRQKCALTEPFKSEGRGWGLRSLQGIKMGDFVVEYVGELIDEETCEKRIKQYHDRDIQDYYFLTIDKDNIIDAYPKGNLSRFMNHSCDPNCITQKWTVNGEVRVGLFANRDIAVGEELCFNYNLDCRGNEKKQCKCGCKNCSGWIGVQPKTQHAMSVAEKAAEKKKKDKLKRKRRMEKLKKERVVHEDDCFLCGDGGELIMCQRGKCPKAYHVDCLKLEGKPHGKWECPWHFCDECGKKSTSLCLLCTNSFCDVHKEGEMIIMEDEGVQICIDHEEDEIRELFLMMEKKKEVAARAAESESDTNGSSGSTTPSEGSVDGEAPAKKQKKSPAGRVQKGRAGAHVKVAGTDRPKTPPASGEKKPSNISRKNSRSDGSKSRPLPSQSNKKTPPDKKKPPSKVHKSKPHPEVVKVKASPAKSDKKSRLDGDTKSRSNVGESKPRQRASGKNPRSSADRKAVENKKKQGGIVGQKKQQHSTVKEGQHKKAGTVDKKKLLIKVGKGTNKKAPVKSSKIQKAIGKGLKGKASSASNASKVKAQKKNV